VQACITRIIVEEIAMNKKPVLFIHALAFVGLAFVSGNLLARPPDLPDVPVVIVSPLAPSGAVAVEGEVTIGNQELRVPFQKSSSWDDWAAGDLRSFSTDIPPDKRLIVQTVSISAFVESGQNVRANCTSQGPSVGSSSHPIPLTKQGTFGGLDLYVGTTSLTAYAESTGGLLVGVIRNSMAGNGGKVNFSVSGYIVDTM
jgi:hypothetical protein